MATRILPQSHGVPASPFFFYRVPPGPIKPVLELSCLTVLLGYEVETFPGHWGKILRGSGWRSLPKRTDFILPLRAIARNWDILYFRPGL